MDAKLSITNVCGARCVTCPNWKQPERTMSFEDFKAVWKKLNDEPRIHRILINNVGDVNELSDSIRYLTEMEERKKAVIMTTNANSLVYVPKIDELIISFNGGTRETYEYTTGLNWNKVRENIRNAYPQLERLPKVEMHCLMWEGNKGTEGELLRTWSDFPGRIRFGYKVENQGGDYTGIKEFKDDERIPCDYLAMLSVAPSGKVITCAHDFAEETELGNIITDSLDDIFKHPNRLDKIRKHQHGVFDGLCEKCNYNVTTEGKFVYGK